MEKVVFKCYRLFSHGKNKGKVNLDSIFHITLFRQPEPNMGNYESVGACLKRCKAFFNDPTMHVVIQSAKESETERLARYKKDGLELISEPVANKDHAKEAGDETMVKDTLPSLADKLLDAGYVPVPIINQPAEAVAA